MTSLARRERLALAEDALGLGPDVPTLCGDWTARDLVAHLVVREGSPLSAVGILVPPLAGLTERAMRRQASRPFADLVADLRDPGLAPLALPPIDRLVNTVELLVHHEDLRRGQPEWEPRTLLPSDEDGLWRWLSVAGRLLVRPAGVPVVVRRADRPGTTVTLRGGADPVTVSGPPSEVLLLLIGRQGVARVDLDGPADAVRRLREAELGY